MEVETMNRAVVIGAYHEWYSRSRILFKSLRCHGFKVKEWNVQAPLWLQYARFIKYSPRIVRDALQSRFIIVPYPGWKKIFFAKIVSIITRRKLVFDSFISNYNTWIEDRNYHSTKSLWAIYYWLLDKITCSLADVVLLDTEEHIDYLSRRTGIDKQKFLRVFVGADLEDSEVKSSQSKTSKDTTIFFYGSMSPLQGIQYIINAMKVLKDEGLQFRFVLIGGGQEADIVDGMVKEYGLTSIVDRYSFMPYEQLLEHIRQADLCLGIFGGTRKSNMVIPNKVFDYAALNKVFITQRSDAMSELFQENSDFIGCIPADPKVLCDTIKNTLSNLDVLEKKLNPRKTIEQHAMPGTIGKSFILGLKERGVLTKD